jgi:hypothetical protein
MSELRPDPSHTSDRGSVVRDAKIEELLLVGLDHYFVGRYEQAINVWTRVLFLDRGHARARAYIERARNAVAEELRESEELLQGGIAAFNRGDADLARRLLDASVERGGPSDLALAFLARLERYEPASGEAVRAEPVAALRPPLPSVPVRRLRGRLQPIVILTLVSLAISVGVIALPGRLVEFWNSDVGDRPIPPSSVVPVPPEALIVPRAAEGALARAGQMYVRGHLNDALVELEQVRMTDPLRADADRLKALIQRRLIEAAVAPLRAAHVDPRP